MLSDTHAVTLRIPVDLYAWLKSEAESDFNRPVSNLILSLLGRCRDSAPRKAAPAPTIVSPPHKKPPSPPADTPGRVSAETQAVIDEWDAAPVDREAWLKDVEASGVYDAPEPKPTGTLTDVERETARMIDEWANEEDE